MNPEAFPFFDPDYFRKIREAQERAYARMMQECFGSTADPRRPIEGRARSDLDARIYSDDPWFIEDEIERLLESL